MSENAVLDKPIIGLPPVKYSLAESQIAEWREQFKDLKADSTAGYEAVTKAIAVTRKARGDIERTRVMLKSSALQYGRDVDAEATRLREMVEAIEDPLRAQKDAIDNAKRLEAEAKAKAVEEAQKAEAKRIADEIEAKRQAELAAERAKLKEEADRLAAERAKIDAERAAERARQEAEQKLERDRLAEERKKLLAEQAERERQARIESERLQMERTIAEAKLAKERDEMEQERRKLEAEKRAAQMEREKADRAEFERVAKLKAEADAKAWAERQEKERIEMDRRRAEEAEREHREAMERAAAEQRRQEEMRPDIERIRAFGREIGRLKCQEVSDAKAKAFVKRVSAALKKLASQCQNCTVQETEAASMLETANADSGAAFPFDSRR